MSKALPSACPWLLLLVGSLGLLSPAVAKPPDLPINLEDMLPPQQTPDYGSDVLHPLPVEPVLQPEPLQVPMPEILQPQFPPPPLQVAGPVNEAGMVVLPAGACPADMCQPPPPPAPADPKRVWRKMRPAVRRELASCLLFSVHPLLALVETGPLVEVREDHPPSSSVTVPMFRFWNGLGIGCGVGCEQSISEQPTGCLMFGVGVNSDAGCSGSCTPPPCGQGGVEMFRFWVGWSGRWALQAEEAAAPVPEQLQCMPRPVCEAQPDCPSSTCPWMQQHSRECQDSTPDPQMTNDVLTNLYNLMDAEELVQLGEKLRQRGLVSEALDCYGLAKRICPGSRYEESAQKAMQEICQGAPETSEVCSAEKQKAQTETEKSPTAWKDEIKHKLQNPVTLNITDEPLSQVLDDLRTWQGFNLVVDTRALKEEGICLDTPVTIKVEQISLKSALQLLLHMHGLTYVLKHEVLLITAEKKHPVEKEPVPVKSCPNGCLEGKCCPNCPKGCSNPCCNSKCTCHEQGKCCCARKKGQKCGGSCCSPSDTKEASGCCCPCCCPCKHKGCCTKSGSCPCHQKPADSKPKEKPTGCGVPQTCVPQPALPPVDPALVPALHKALLETADNTASSQASSDCQETQWSQCCPDTLQQSQLSAGSTEESEEVPLSETMWEDFREILGNVTCADMMTTANQLRLGCQFKLGERVYQVSYGMGGLNVNIQPLPAAGYE